MNQYLKFYNKKGEFCNNFTYDPLSNSWSGRIDFFTMSEGLIENFQIYVLEEVFNSNTDQIENSLPLFNEWTVQLQKTPEVSEFFIYDVTSSILSKYQSFALNGSEQGWSPLENGMKEVEYSISAALQLNLGFQPSKEDGFETTLTISNGSNLVATFTLYGEGEGEDERLKDLLTTIGYDVLPSDIKIFDVFDIKEENPDWTLINRKRKELLLEYQNIFPYIGSYKALINILKFYGYQNVKMKEYWKNVDVNSPNFGKSRQVDIGDIFSERPNPAISDLIPSKIYRKLNLFSLVYEINVESGEFDNEGIPITVDALQFSQEEVLIKLFALRNKLREYYLPVNAKIIDIIGEAIYFASYNISHVNSFNRIEDVSLGIKPTYEISPIQEYYIRDLRPLQYLGAPVGPDMNAGGVTNVLIWRPSVDRGINAYIDYADVFFTIAGMTAGITSWRLDPNHGSTTYTQQEVMQALVDSINNPVFVEGKNIQSDLEIIKNDFYAYSEYPDIYVRIVEKIPGKYESSDSCILNSHPYLGFSLSDLPNPNTAPGENLSPNGTYGPNGAPINLFGSAYLGTFDPMNLPIQNLNDDEGIPVGCPILLTNTSFNSTWDDMSVTYNAIDTPGPSGTHSTLFSDFIRSFDIIGWTSISGDVSPITIPVSGFPIDFPHQFGYTWNNLGHQGYTEMQWIITKNANEYPDFIYDSGQLPIDKLNEIGVILPYVGVYNIILNIWDSYNNRSFSITKDVIEVKMLDPDFIGWYTHREKDYTWDSAYIKKDEIQSSIHIPNPPLGSLKREITWDEYTSTWDLPLHPNESMDMIEMTYNSIDSTKFYNTMKNPIDNPLVDRDAYKYDLLGEQATSDDSYHLWSDACGTRLVQFNLEFFGTAFYLAISRANCTAPMDGSKTIWYLDSSIGFTGATGSLSYTPTASSGDWLYVAENQYAYVCDGSQWNYQDNKGEDRLDVLYIPYFFYDYATLCQILSSCSTESVFNDFIYYSSFRYNTDSSNLVPYIEAISKDFSVNGRYKMYSSNAYGGQIININGSTGSTFSSGIAYETQNLGYIGDIPTSFEIYKVPPIGPTGSFTITYQSEIVTGSTSYTYNVNSTTLSDLCFELNGSTAQSTPVIGDFDYKLNVGYPGWTGLGPTSSYSILKIQAIAKSFTYPQSIGVTYGFGMIGSSYGRSVIKNPTWDSIRVMKYSQSLPLLTTVNFTYDNSKIPGKTNPTWILQKEDDPNFSDIYYNNQYFSYMFNEKGSYSLSLIIEDTNSNSNTITKKEIIKII